MMPSLLLIAKRWIWDAFYGVLFSLILALSALFLGRWWCGWARPNGLMQEALNKLPIPKFEVRAVDLSPIKWGFLTAWIVTGLLPARGHLACITCQFSNRWAWLWYLITGNQAYSCYYGGCFTHLYLFTIVFYMMALFLVGRTWCRTFCFVGQSTGLLHWIRVKLGIARHIIRDMKLCKACGICSKVCLTGDLTIFSEVSNKFYDCVMCQRCIAICPNKALRCSKH